MNIIAWGNVAPWAEQRQVEQDLVISRALVELFSDAFLKEALLFRGGTALNKLHFPEPFRYSEDIDLVRTTSGPIKPVLEHVRETLEPWLGGAAYRRSAVAPKLIFRVQAEDGATLRLKIEISIWETESLDGWRSMTYGVENPWFAGRAEIPTYSREEMLATKLRALLQRQKGRDLFDLAHAIAVFDGLDTYRVVDMFQRYLALQELSISRAEAEERMFAKLARPGFIADVRPLLAAPEAERLTDKTVNEAFANVFTGFIAHLPGNGWARTEEMIERFGLSLARVR